MTLNLISMCNHNKFAQNSKCFTLKIKSALDSTVAKFYGLEWSIRLNGNIILLELMYL